MRMLSPPSISPPFAAYAHGVEVPAGARIVVTSGQLALARDGTVPEGALAQARLCLAQILLVNLDGFLFERIGLLLDGKFILLSFLVIQISRALRFHQYPAEVVVHLGQIVGGC